MQGCLGGLCPSLPLPFALPPFLWASSLFSLLAGGCILAPPLDLRPDFGHPLHKDLGEQRLEVDLAGGWILAPPRGPLLDPLRMSTRMDIAS